MQTVVVTQGAPPFFAACREFTSEHEAAAAWQDLNRYARKLRGKLDLGVYRHSIEGSPVRYITAVSLNEQSVETAERRLHGREHLLDEPTLRAFALRRAKFVLDLLASGAESGSYAIQRGTRGARIHPDGSMDEQIGSG